LKQLPVALHSQPISQETLIYACPLGHGIFIRLRGLSLGKIPQPLTGIFSAASMQQPEPALMTARLLFFGKE
jgi:hypothetical protein